MKTLVKYLKEFLKEDFRLIAYLPVLAYLACCLAINYSLNFEHTVLDAYVNTFGGYLLYLLFNSIAYFPVVIYVLYMNGKTYILKDTGFWTKSVFVMLTLSASGFFSYYNQITDLFSASGERYLIKKILVNSRNVFLILTPLLLFWLFLKPYKSGFLWVKIKEQKLFPYFLILMIMTPVVFIASFGSDFQHTYPTFKPWFTQESFGLKVWQMAGVYEIFYGLDFITVEMIFRGALVIGMSKILGKDCILPMISVYCFLHFGKPLGEAVSSIFGGYILGVIALNTKSIVGGSIVHMGVAWLMEIFALLQYYFIQSH